MEGVESAARDHDDASLSPLAELLDSALPADIVASQVFSVGGGWLAWGVLWASVLLPWRRRQYCCWCG